MCAIWLAWLSRWSPEAQKRPLTVSRLSAPDSFSHVIASKLQPQALHTREGVSSKPSMYMKCLCLLVSCFHFLILFVSVGEGGPTQLLHLDISIPAQILQLHACKPNGQLVPIVTIHAYICTLIYTFGECYSSFLTQNNTMSNEEINPIERSARSDPRLKR
jgi:hypothetical protein